MQPRKERIRTATRPVAAPLGHIPAEGQLLFPAVAQEVRRCGQAPLGETPGGPTQSEVPTHGAPTTCSLQPSLSGSGNDPAAWEAEDQGNPLHVKRRLEHSAWLASWGRLLRPWEPPQTPIDALCLTPLGSLAARREDTPKQTKHPQRIRAEKPGGWEAVSAQNYMFGRWNCSSRIYHQSRIAQKPSSDKL